VPSEPGRARGQDVKSHATACDVPGSGRYQLLKGLDDTKDQSYFLHRLNQAQLSKTLFPVGELRKTEVRRIAEEIGCQREEEGFDRHLLHRRAPFPRVPQPLHLEGTRADQGRARRVVGQHQGLSSTRWASARAWHRRRQGAKAREMGGDTRPRVAGGGDYHAPWFVARKDMESNTLWVVQGHDHPWLQSSALDADDASWVSGAAPAPGRYAAKTRYRQADAPCALSASTPDTFHLEFSEPQWAVTPGQSAVLYAGEVCLGGGVIAAQLARTEYRRPYRRNRSTAGRAGRWAAGAPVRCAAGGARRRAAAPFVVTGRAPMPSRPPSSCIRWR